MTSMINKSSLRRSIALGVALIGLSSSLSAAAGPRWMEVLDRGAVAVPAKEGGNLISWRLLATDSPKTVFDVYRDGKKVNARPLDGATNLVDKDGTSQSSYVVHALLEGKELESNAPVKVWSAGYLSVPIQQPTGGSNESGAYTYQASDASVGDLDGDGQYEIVLKWDPTNSKDNSQVGVTGNVILDAYTLSGKRLWRIDLGRNIRAGAHYTQFLVYDFDGDGKAEVVMKTADGSTDGLGNIIGDPKADWRTLEGEAPSPDPKGSRLLPDGTRMAPLQGRIMDGPEYLTVFEGTTGRALTTVPYDPPRYPGGKGTPEQMKELWGDSYANRVDRFLAGVAYLDGERPSIVMTRGYYAKATLAAWDYRDGKLTKRWFFDSDAQAEPAKWRGQGNHSLSIADVDGDGRDEIIFGSMVIDDNGTGLWSTGLRHGDALHVGDFDPSNPGLERFGVHEESARNGNIMTSMVDAKSGKLLWTVNGTGDNGRGIIMDIDPRYPGAESWTSDDTELRDAKGNSIGKVKPKTNKFAVWWDGDLLREQLESMSLYKWNWREQRSELLLEAVGTTIKGAPCLSADILGDWREEVILPATDNQSLRIYATPYPTEHRLVTLMHDSQYRVAIAWQNTTYNQPPHPSFFLGDGMKAPPTPQILPRKYIQAQVAWAGQGHLFVGTCYQPVDRAPEQVKLDIALMKKAGLQVVRMGDLSWDYFEPRNGEFTWEAFDSVMDQMQAAGIQVILDVGGSIAPQWLHQRFPGATIVKEDGTTSYPARRYMVDISDPDYRRLLHRFAEALTLRYGRHPAVIAIGYNNEMGNGYRSYSEPARQRFIAWLKARYHDLPTLNKAWATQRWSRNISDWDQVRIPNSEGPSPSERYLDMRRFWSEAAIDLLRDLDSIRRKHAPALPVISNLWSDGRLGFDYLASYRDYTTHGAFGYYATNVVEGAFETMMMKGGLSSPVWFNEFQAGGEGFYGEKGRSRMLGYFGLINGGQGMLAWTFNSHIGGEEQIIFGLLDHDDTPSWKLEEWGAIAKEFKLMQQLGFPRDLKPEVALSYSWESRQAAGSRVKAYYVTPYMDHKHNAFAPLFNDNIDVAVINISHEDLSRYKLLVIAGEYLMDKATTAAVRKYVSEGGTVVMTASSDKVNENSQWHNTSFPGELCDVFGLKTHEFYSQPSPFTGTIQGIDFKTSLHFYEVLEPSTAEVLARFSNLEGTPPVVTVNRFGKGRAIYVATQSQPSVLQPLYRYLYAELGLKRGPVTPDGVYAREVKGRILYVNTNRKAVEIEIDGEHKGLLSGRTWSGKLQLGSNGVDILE